MSIVNMSTIKMSSANISSATDIAQLEQAVPFEKACQFTNTYDAIKATADRIPNHTAISFFLNGKDYKKPIDINYQTLINKITQTSNFFNNLGLSSDDVVAFILPNLPETHYVLWGAEARCQVFAINPLLEPEQIKELINSAKAKAVITMNPMPQIDLWEKLEGIMPDLTYTKYVIGVDIAQHVNGLKGYVAKTIQGVTRMSLKVPENLIYHNFVPSISGFNKDQLDFTREFEEDTISSLFCTGGTTGLPKIARRTHRNELANATSVQAMAPSFMQEGKTMLGGLPLFHVNGALVTGLVPFMVGARVVILTPQGYRGENVFPNFWSIIEHFKVNAFSGVPTVYSALMNFPIDGKDISSLDFCICGAAPMPVETFKAFEKMTGTKILEGYGLTEGTCVSSLSPPNGERKVGSIGIRIPYQEMMCAEIDNHNEIIRKCDTNEIGILLVRGPNVFLGYQHEHQNQGLWVIDEQGRRWLNTGDMARQDEEGYFWLTGRKKELIVRGGHNIEPKMIEEAMCKHPDVSLAAAVGRPDLHAGEVPVCYVQTANKALTKEDLLSFASEHIPERAAIPKDIYTLPELPVTAVGKVFKPELEKREINKKVVSEIDPILPKSQFSVDVVQSPLHGLLAEIKLINCSDLDMKNIDQRLGGYTFKYTFFQ